jgi:hypothetical protein
MDFWTAYGGDIKHSEINNLIKDGTPLETLFEQPTFLDEFYSQQSYLVEYLSRLDVVQKLVSYITEVDDFEKNSYTSACHYPFYAFTIFSNCNVKITEILYNNEELLSDLLFVGSKNPDQYITSQGYLFGMVKNWLAPTNPLADTFIKILKSQSEKFVLPLIHHLCRSNAEIIKEILSSNAENFHDYQASIFEYVIYFYLNEKFDADFVEANSEVFQNLFSIFKFLTEESIKFEYKKNYIQKLFYIKCIKNQDLLFELSYFRVIVLNYLAKTKQIKSQVIDIVFANQYNNFELRSQRIAYLVSILSFYRLLSANPEFLEFVKIEFVEFLVGLLRFAPKNDILHFNLVSTLTNISGWINSNPQALFNTCSFIFNEHSLIASQPDRKQVGPSFISTHFLGKILDKLDVERLADPRLKYQINQLKQLYTQIFKKLCFEGVNESAISLKRANIKLDIDNEFELFGSQQAKESHEGIRNTFEPAKTHIGLSNNGQHENKAILENFKLEPPKANRKDPFANLDFNKGAVTTSSVLNPIPTINPSYGSSKNGTFEITGHTTKNPNSDLFTK